MGRELRQRKRKVEQAWQAFDGMAKTGPEKMRERFEGYSESLHGKPLEEQERIVREAVRETWEVLKPVLVAMHRAMSKAVEPSGMTLEDYAWLRDFAPPEDEEGRY